MSGWECLLGVLGFFALYTPWVCWRILRDNRPRPRWPGDP